MSRIGKLPIKLNNAKIEVKPDVIIVSGPKGTLEVPFFKNFNLDVVNGIATITKKKNIDTLNAVWGLFRSLLANAVIGVVDGYEKRLEMVGVGYRAQKSTKGLNLNVGLSHVVEFDAPDGITLDVEDNTKIIVRGFDKQKVGHVAAQIRKIRVPEPYKGKGIKYAGERIRRKAGKAGKASE
ncbi:50S ribosomal protein L6 [candidate division WWE3 bacterium CG10_big_fil_rev_8_21_14_0_10_32_10]|uniref:50S ribosomal protein L6 n=1 Tax=candidate division WWE3 bacterium CG10_big_fil_rev_8_21_14_0_10_32_10 TaxID=1975090 RepID=A0A2H0RB21_UNCKA|nr:MAG: 50S ribosomal protein L6 [candidate division WWE3 bacterium CG10_big_fil_rev_8_21_14_0_10_32_10]